MNNIKLEVGKAYRTRCGEKVIIQSHETGNKFFKLVGRGDNDRILTFSETGNYCINKLSGNDIISEWEEEPKTHFEQSVPSISEVRTDDKVNHPSHYTTGKVECIDAIESATTGLTGIEAVCTANAIKYLWRWKQKNGVEDLKKAQWYVNNLIEKL